MYAGDNLSLKRINFSESFEWNAEKRQLCFLLVTHGKGRHDAADISQILTPGDLLVANKSSGGKLTPLDGQGFSALRFLLCFDQLGSLLGLAEVSLLQKVSARFGNARYYPASNRLIQQCQVMLEAAPPINTLEHRVHLLRVASTVLSEEFENARKEQTQPSNGNGDFSNLMSRLSLEDMQSLSVVDLAKKLGYSRRHLNRLFQEHLGTSVSALKMEVRLLKSLFLLKDPSAKVIDVAMECGFNHLGLFSQCFKRRFHVSPNQWRLQELGKLPKETAGSFVKRDCQLQATGMCMWSNLQGQNGELQLCEDFTCRNQKELPKKPRAPLGANAD